jgi:hypothetical protein
MRDRSHLVEERHVEGTVEVVSTVEEDDSCRRG